MIDLHTHSTASDGTLSPEALVELAAERGLSAIALTDHDTVAGVAPAQERGKSLSVEVVPAVELGASLDGVGEIHLLGYFIDLNDLPPSNRSSSNVRVGPGIGRSVAYAKKGAGSEWNPVQIMAPSVRGTKILEGWSIPWLRWSTVRFKSSLKQSYWIVAKAFSKLSGDSKPQ